MKTPGVYIVEKNAFPNAVVEVATAVPAFIGYTEIADNAGKSLTNQPFRITSMAEFERYFGGAPRPAFTVVSVGDDPAPGVADVTVRHVDGHATGYLVGLAGLVRYRLHRAMRHFFQNGGDACWVVSVGGFGTDDPVAVAPLMDGLSELEKEQEPTLVVVPDAVELEQDAFYDLARAMLAHCGATMRNRFAILDVWRGDRELGAPEGDCIKTFRDSIGTDNLAYGAAYYPWVHTRIVQERELSFVDFAGSSLALMEILECDLQPSALPLLEDVIRSDWAAHADAERVKTTPQPSQTQQATWNSGGRDDWIKQRIAEVDKALVEASPAFATLIAAAASRLNLMAPSAAMAGLYTMVDNSRGVWKAPANVSLNNVVAPSAAVSDAQQAELNVTASGKSINAIRSFPGQGTLVWGARTLDGDSQDWRYISVRRTMIMLEESCKLAAKAFVFEPNDANTWVTVKSMIQNFLTGVWRRGGLAGAVADDAFSVQVGLGETMTAEDILEGVMRVTVLVAIIRPAEFIAITFQQQMQKS